MENKEFETIYQKYVHQVFCFLLKLSGDYYISEDITQETFVKAYMSIEQFRGECQLNVWLCQIGKNLFCDYCKKSKLNIPLETMEKIPIYAGQDGLLEKMISKENIEIFNHYILGLKEPYQTIFISRVFEELSYSEIGSQFNKSGNWVRVNFYRAKQKLQNIISVNEKKG